MLESQGLAAAVAAHARRLPIPVQVDACELRFARPVETAIYFCCVEALQNSAKHSCALRAWITIGVADGRLHFEVGDNGIGFDPSAARMGSGLQNIRDRIDAMDGTVDVRSAVGGTCIRGHVPLGRTKQRADARRRDY